MNETPQFGQARVLPTAWRAINDYGIGIDYRTYDSPELGRWRRQHSGVTAKRGLWEVHHDPYDLSRVFVRTPDGWVVAPWTHLPMISAPFADFTWGHARRLAAQASLDDTEETDVARVLDELLTRAQTGPRCCPSRTNQTTTMTAPMAVRSARPCRWPRSGSSTSTPRLRGGHDPPRHDRAACA